MRARVENAQLKQELGREVEAGELLTASIELMRAEQERTLRHRLDTALTPLSHRSDTALTQTRMHRHARRELCTDNCLDEAPPSPMNPSNDVVGCSLV